MLRVTPAPAVSTDATVVSLSLLTQPPTTPPGSFFLAVIPGFMGRSVSAAQAFMRGGSLWTHAGIYIGDDTIVQAEWAGVRVRQFPDRYCSGPVLWSDAPIQRHLADVPNASREYEPRLRAGVVAAALSLVGTGYAWLDLLSIVAAEWRVPGWEQLHRRSGDRVLCSSLVDQVYATAGVHLFADRRPVGQVAPADLARYDETWVRERLDHLEGRVTSIEERLS